MQSFTDYLNENLGSKHLTPDGKRSQRKKDQHMDSVRSLAAISKDIKDEMRELSVSTKRNDISRYSDQSKDIGLEKIPKEDYYKDTPHRQPRAMKRIFTLAHEAGHANQYRTPHHEVFQKVMHRMLTGEPYSDSWDFEEEYLNTLKDHFESFSDDKQEMIVNMRQLYAEADAWLQGYKYIPKEFHSDYWKHAQDRFNTYLESSMAAPYVSNMDIFQPFKKYLDF